MESPRIDLAHEPDFTIGRLSVHPSTRELSLGLERIVIEPRVMQVLVALHRAGGAVVSKDDLAQSCWEGRVVGEDAINRVLSRLRKVTEGIGKGVFRVETVTRVGYRMVVEGEANTSTMSLGQSESAERKGIDRRVVIAGAGVALAGASGGWFLYNRRPPLPGELAMLIDKAESAQNYYTDEQTAAAVGLLQEATRRFPDRAEAWGKLAVAYYRQGWNNWQADATDILNRAEAAARRALELDPENADGAVIVAVGRGHWYSDYLEYDRRSRLAFARYPMHDAARRSRATFMYEVGRLREAININGPLVTVPLPSPLGAAIHARALWAAGRPDEAEAMLNTLIGRWPRHATVWVSRFSFFSYSGKVNEAENMLSDINARPIGIGESDFALWSAQSLAIKNREQADIATALRLHAAAASSNISHVPGAAMFSSATGQLDAAFAYLDFFFSTEATRILIPNFPAEDLRPHSGRLTFFLFEPPMEAVRADPRFEVLTARLGLKDYWRKANVKPDYLV